MPPTHISIVEGAVESPWGVRGESVGNPREVPRWSVESLWGVRGGSVGGQKSKVLV